MPSAVSAPPRDSTQNSTKRLQQSVPLRVGFRFATNGIDFI